MRYLIFTFLLISFSSCNTESTPSIEITELNSIKSFIIQNYSTLSSVKQINSNAKLIYVSDVYINEMKYLENHDEIVELIKKLNIDSFGILNKEAFTVDLKSLEEHSMDSYEVYFYVYAESNSDLKFIEQELKFDTLEEIENNWWLATKTVGLAI